MLKYNAELQTELVTAINNFCLANAPALAQNQLAEEIVSTYSIYYGCDVLAITNEQFINRIKYRLYDRVEKFKKLNADGVYLLSKIKSGNREANTTSSGANELQPLNASITEITSPTSKSKGVTNGSETWSEISPYEERENLKLIFKETLSDLLKEVIMPMFDFYSKIY